jgi:hypothetical protein
MIQTKYLHKIALELPWCTSLLTQWDIFISSAMGRYSEENSDSFVLLWNHLYFIWLPATQSLWDLNLSQKWAITSLLKLMIMNNNVTQLCENSVH